MDPAPRRNTKPHAVVIPYPSQGHVTPLIALAKLLHSRGFHITFVNTEFNHRRLVRSHGAHFMEGLPDFQFQAIPDGLPPSNQDATQHVPSLCDSVRKNCLGPFRELLARLNSCPELPKVSCVVADGVMSFGIDAAAELGVPAVQFWTASACSFMAYLHYRELVRRGIFPFKDDNFMVDFTLETPIDWIPGMRNIRLRDIPSHIRTTNPDSIMFDFMGEEAQNCLKSTAILFNTFDAFEHEVLSAIADKFPDIYTIGPIPLMTHHIVHEPDLKAVQSSLWKEDMKCLEWLDKREPESVVYVNFGSVTVMTEQHLREFAWGLANSNCPFLWIVRKDIVMGDSATLPAEFSDEVKERGLLVDWCPQYDVLKHPAVGAFLTHCGWNSVMESVCAGVPMICWPFFADQQTNCRYACTEWGTGVEVDGDVRREEIESMVREVMGGEKGWEMRERAQYWKKEAEAANSVGGLSRTAFDRFLKEVLHHEGYDIY
ncbi:hypothetical protein CRG98_002323 [Punica granatum]|uniref:Glycosyltransferase n=1 Tax=Punica granatum TaxID=22663 RepID=A0A2I0L9K9_PUNGR|nr:hypothetical protein CRG98_002323 [Punica granatum]